MLCSTITRECCYWNDSVPRICSWIHPRKLLLAYFAPFIPNIFERPNVWYIITLTRVLVNPIALIRGGGCVNMFEVGGIEKDVLVLRHSEPSHCSRTFACMGFSNKTIRFFNIMIGKDKQRWKFYSFFFLLATWRLLKVEKIYYQSKVQRAIGET